MLVKEPEKKWRFIRDASVALAVINEASYAYQVQQERRERDEERREWLRQAVERRLREELAKLLVEVNEEKRIRRTITGRSHWGIEYRDHARHRSQTAT